jgi:hypothetical protein
MTDDPAELRDAESADVETPKTKSPGEFVRVYVVVMALMAAFLGWLWWHNDAQADDYRKANDAAKTIFGEGPAGQPFPDRPTTIRQLAVGAIKYLATKKEAGKASGDGTLIPVQTLSDREKFSNLTAQNTGNEQIVKNPAKRYEEISVAITFEPTNLNDLAHFLYNIEQSSALFRILSFDWDLKMPEKDNPIVAGSQYGNLTTRPHVKVGFRRPSTGGK